MDNSLFTTEPFLTGKPLETWLASMGIRNWRINGGLVDVDGSVALRGALGTLKRLPVRFGKVGGDFGCSHNQLVSLEGAPKEVGRVFCCGYNQLVSLEGAPQKVGGHFWCCCNRLLVSLEGAPERVGGDFNCKENQLVSLEGAPRKVGGVLRCTHNLLVDFKGLEGVSIEGSLIVTNPSEAGQDNVFVSLEGLPKELYSKLRGLDVQAVLELEKKRATRLLGDEREGLISEVELG